ncbi:MAG: aldo/keto reductase [Phycisphaerales bacterium]|nr:aldo/keto reductase [Phycisphaerales bacterium]
MSYAPAEERYEKSDQWFRRCGDSGLLLPAISLGCWHNFGDAGTDAAKHADESSFHDNCRQMLFTAFDHGITHFDLANNYGPKPGAAESRVGRILKEDFSSYRDELIISSKAGYRMWPGPYGEWGSRKYVVASCDQSLKRLQLDYVDIFYSHRPDPKTPLEETLFALDTIVRQGKALYAGISSYSGAQTADVIRICEANGYVKPIIHQPSYSMLNRGIEKDLIPITDRFGLGTIAFCPLAQGLLTSKYLTAIPEDSRAKQAGSALNEGNVKPALVRKLNALNDLAASRSQSLAQMALTWTLRHQGKVGVTTALIGASRPQQIVENVKIYDAPALSAHELEQVESILNA